VRKFDSPNRLRSETTAPVWPIMQFKPVKTPMVLCTAWKRTTTTT
jgi:hypothetical protein